MSATIYSIPEQFKNTLPDIFEIRDGSYQEKEDQWVADLEDFIRGQYGVGQYIGRTIKFSVADGYAVYMVASLGAKPELIHLPLMDGYQFQYAHLMTASEIKKQIDADDRMTAYLDSWKSQTVGDVEAVLNAHATKSDESHKDGYVLIEWRNEHYVLPVYDSSHGYDHGMYKYLCNLNLRK